MNNQEVKKDAKAEQPEAAGVTEKKAQCSCLSKWVCQSRTFKIITAAVGLILIILLSFAAGAGIALHKARFNCFHNQGSDRNFMGQQMMEKREGGPMKFLHEFEGRDFRSGHGLAGTITSVSENTFIVKDRNNKETTIAVTDQTIIRSNGNNLKISDLKANDRAVIMGQPGDNGVINANLIRVLAANQNNQ